MSNPVISRFEWYGFPAVQLESERMRVVIVPKLGAKIVSLVDRSCGHEWLSPPARPLRRCAYGDGFVDQDMSGWDEMMPTIVACAVGDAQLPDHGEVWSIPWQAEQQDAALVTRVDGVAMSYRLTRSAALPAADCLRLEYTVENHGDAPLPFLWAAHPQFLANEHTRIVLPKSALQVLNVIDGDPLWGADGTRLPWPVARGLDGVSWALDRVRPVNSPPTCRKVYLPPESPVGEAALLQKDLGITLRLRWTADTIPYLGIWVDEGAYNPLPVVALEPSNGYYDGLDRAIRNRRAAVLEPGESQHWHLEVSFSGQD